MFTIRAHGVPRAHGDTAGLSPAQQRLLREPRPIRVCGAPTGAGKTHAFLHAAGEPGRWVVFVVPTQALARDVEIGARQQGLVVHRWDGVQSAELRREGQEPWWVRKTQLDELRRRGGLLVTTPETLGMVVLGESPRRVLHQPLIQDFLSASHIVFDEAHTLTPRAFGFLHFWALLAVWWHSVDPERAPRLTLLSATHSNLFDGLCQMDAGESAYLPPECVAFFDEALEDGRQDRLRMLHGDVIVETMAGGIADVLARHGEEAVRPGARLLLLYDSLWKLARDEERLRTLLTPLGVAPDECFMINGQDRKGGQHSLGGTGFEAGFYPEARHRVVIATSCLEAGVNLPGLTHAILDPGQDAAALLQRIGRVARGDLDGRVWLTTPEDPRQHWLRLQKLSGMLTVTELYQALSPLRLLPIDQARRLGSAYWSMLRRKNPALYTGLRRGHEALSEAKAPGAFLNALHAQAGQVSRRNRPRYQVWLDGVDRALTDLREFAPTIRLQFADHPVIEYSRDWVMAYLKPPESIEAHGDDVVWRYRGPRVDYLREKPRPIPVSLLCPTNAIFQREFYPSVLAREVRDAYARHIDTTAKGHPDEAFLFMASDFVKATGIVVPSDSACSESIL